MINAVFPNLIHSIQIKNFEKVQNELIDFVYAEESKNPIGQLFSNRGGWQSNPFYHETIPYPYDNLLFSTLNEEIESYFSDSIIFRENLKISYTGLWLNINKSGDYNAWHCHPNSDLSGVFWIQVPSEGDFGNINFASPHEFIEHKSFKIYNSRVTDEFNYAEGYRVAPSSGTILVFPSHLYHEVLPNQTRKDRISASFNLKIDMI